VMINNLSYAGTGQNIAPGKHRNHKQLESWIEFYQRYVRESEHRRCQTRPRR
jgi:hypothetical protein